MAVTCAVGAGLMARSLGGDWTMLGWVLVASAAAIAVYALIHAD